MALVRSSRGFRRYAFSIKYNGTAFLGFSYQGVIGENCITPDGTDLRGIYSIEGKLRAAFDTLMGGKDHGGKDQYENIQVSSRTDRGVHAWKNTFHIDVKRDWEGDTFVKGLNFHLIRHARNQIDKQYHRTRQGHNVYPNYDSSGAFLYSTENDIRLTKCLPAPLEQIENKQFMSHGNSQPQFIDWNARFTATSRTYTYRIITGDDGMPFEANNAWRINPNRKDATNIDLESMRIASKYLLGKHDFTSFRGKKCNRSSPFVNMQAIEIHSRPLSSCYFGVTDDSLLLPHLDKSMSQLVTITIRGDAFLYRQVRNMVGCLVAVGHREIKPQDVQEILLAKKRNQAPAMAPAHGLFLANVEHRDFDL